MRATRSRVRGAALMAVAAFALHEARYALAPAEAADASDHAYVPLVAALVVMLCAVAAGELALALARARDDGTGESGPRAFRMAWLVSSLGLLAIFTGQELTETVLAGGSVLNPFAGGGIWALPLAPALGYLVALALRWAGAVVRRAAGRPWGRPRRPGLADRPVWRPLRPAGSVIARHLAGRAPPLAS